MTGLVGFLQKYIDRDVYDVHVPLFRKALVDAHVVAGLSVQDSCNFMAINLGVVNPARHAGTKKGRFLQRVLSITSKVIWIIERHLFRFPTNGFTSPYILVLANCRSRV